MAAIDFPNSPTLNQTFTAAGLTWIWDGAKWTITGSGVVAMSDTPPANPVNGKFWFDTVSGQLFVYYNDGNSSQWVIVVHAPQGVQGPQGIAGPTGPASTVPGPVGPAGPTGATGTMTAYGQVGSTFFSPPAIIGGDVGAKGTTFYTGQTMINYGGTWQQIAHLVAGIATDGYGMDVYQRYI